ncbi:hypothetical protein [Evansella clarkii]|uniref:hypothetical protein n=1 Tax=Evansella clarkii TaxID=79879 RepID=UPI001473D1A0|nr:hypothetical protein [Evansella clarkii]
MIAYVGKRTPEQDVCLFLYNCVEDMLITREETEQQQMNEALWLMRKELKCDT